MSTHAINLLRASARAQKSGELICAGPSIEVHVYLQRGRVAWATDSLHPYEFGRYLRARTSIDETMFGELLDECRRDRLPLGEALVGWKLATWEQVQAALHHQVSLAMRALLEGKGGPALFLDRPRFTEYDERLTFDLSSFITEPEPTAPCGFYWLWPGRLGGVSRPGLVHPVQHDIEALLQLGITTLVTLEEQMTVERAALSARHIESLHFPIIERGAPSLETAKCFCDAVQRRVDAGGVVIFHGRTSAGRAATMLASQLVHAGETASNAAGQIQKAMARDMRSEAQMAFLTAFERLRDHPSQVPDPDNKPRQ